MAGSWKHTLFRMLPQSVKTRLRRTHHLRTVAGYDPAEWAYSELLSALLKPGDTVIDAGANIGYISKCLADMVGGRGQVFACEPIPPTFDSLRHAVEKLDLKAISRL